MKVLIIVAMEDEKRGILNQVDFQVDYYQGFDFFRFKIGEIECFLVKTEVGKVNAAIVSSLFITKFKPNYVINAGIGGGLVENIPILSTIYSTKVAYHDVDLTFFDLPLGQLEHCDLYFRGSKKLLSYAEEDCYKGLVVSGDSFLTRKDQLDKIKQHFPKALVCDMEGASIAHVASMFRRKFIIIRTLSDNIYQKLDINHYCNNKEKAIAIVADKTLKLIQKLQS